MEPLRIRCRPHALFWYDPWMPLDSLLYRAALIEWYGEDYYHLPTLSPSAPLADIIPIGIGVPLERRERHGIWWWACSWADVYRATMAKCDGFWVRQHPHEDAGTYVEHRGRGNLIVKTWKGPDKLYHTPVSALIVDELTWYAYGDSAEIGRLLETYYAAIGKKAAYGFGQLCEYPDGCRWKIEAWREDWSERDGDGRLTRGVPPDGGDFHLSRLRRHGVRPPYWAHANAALLELPQ